MKASSKAPKTSPTAFEDQYRTALRRYALDGGESALSRAYELGRQAMQEGRSLLEVAALFELELAALTEVRANQKPLVEVLRSAAQFLGESMSPYEMAHRGFQDAVKALRGFNEMLEEEIKRIAHAVHDDAGQSLVAVHLALADLACGLGTEKQRQAARIDQLVNEVEERLRHYSHELRPTALDDLGWVAAIRSLARTVSKRAKLPVKVKTGVLKRLSGAVEIALYRIVQEVLTNTTKHAKARCVSIEVFRKAGHLCCVIQDDGVGFDVLAVRANHQRRGLGLLGIQERANSIGALLSIESAPGRGTRVQIRLPMS